MSLKINEEKLLAECRRLNPELKPNPTEFIKEISKDISKKNLRIIKLINKEYKIKDITISHYCKQKSGKNGVEFVYKFMVVCENDEHEYDTYFVFHQIELYHSNKELNKKVKELNAT